MHPRIALFGELSVELAGHVVTRDLPGRQGRALLAYLVLNHPRPVSRDELLTVLWPSDPPAAPEAALSSLLAKLRRVLGPDLVSGRELLALHLPPDTEVDVLKGSELIERAEYALADDDAASALDAAQAALGLLAQPLLPCLQGEWAETWRQHFSELRLRSLEASARAALKLGGGHLTTAERAAGALVEADRFREGNYALLMDTQARRGDIAEALRTFEDLRVLLREELGANPSAALVALHDRLLREGAAPIASPGPEATVLPLPALTPRMIDGAFVGREGCLEQLRARWQESRAGQPRLVLLVGEAGVGKTRLAARFAEEAHADGGAVLYGRVDEDALVPHQPFVEALRHLLAHGGATFAADAERERDVLSRLLPDLGLAADPLAATSTIDYEALRYRLFEAVVALLTRASRRWPLLLVLDDLHWADKPTLLLLRHLLRHPQLAHLLVLGTFRHVEVGREHPLVELLADLRRERRYDRLTLAGLDETDTQALVTDRLGIDVTPGFIRRLQEQTEGNVFFIEETLRALADSDMPLREATTEDALERLGVPEGVAEVIARRVHRLSPLAAEMLSAASIIGRDFRLDIVEQLVDAAPERLMPALEESMASGLLLELPERVDAFSFSHALVREVLYCQLTVSRRVRLHQRVAEALEGLAGSEAVNPAELAHHFQLARHLTGAERARRYTIAAGQRAADLLAYEEAGEHFRRALTLFEDDDEAGRCEVLLALGRVQWHAGDDAARHTFLTAADSASRRGAAEQLARAALGLGERYWEAAFVGSRYRELLEDAVTALGPADSPLRALVLARLAVNLAFPIEHDRAVGLSAEALSIARRLGDVDALVAALLARHVTRLDVRHLDERLALSDELVRVGGGHRELSAECHQWRLYDLFEVGDLDAARSEQVQLEALSKELRQPLFQSIAVGWRGVWAELAGDIDLAERCAEECLRHGQRAHAQDAVSIWAARLFPLRRRQGRLTELTPIVERLVHGGARQAGWPSALALIHAEAGDEKAARTIYKDELANGPDGLPRGMFWLTNVALLSELCAKLDDAERAPALYAALAPHAHRNIVIAYSSFWGPVERYLALLAATAGNQTLATRHARSALERTRAMNAPLLTAEIEARHPDLLP